MTVSLSTMIDTPLGYPGPFPGISQLWGRYSSITAALTLMTDNTSRGAAILSLQKRSKGKQIDQLSALSQVLQGVFQLSRPFSPRACKFGISTMKIIRFTIIRHIRGHNNDTCETLRRACKIAAREGEIVCLNSWYVVTESRAAAVLTMAFSDFACMPTET